MNFQPFARGEASAITVSELNRHAKQLLEQGFPLMWIAGEISNFTRAASGHWYFTLKDSNAQVRCAMFRHKSLYLDWQPANGMQVEVRALVTLYEQRGEFQLTVENLRRSGLGALYEAFEKLKVRLGQEGLFDEARKQVLPSFPQQIGIVTSPAAAALRDVLTTLRRRMPGIPVVLYPVPVQGEGAGAKIAAALGVAAQRRECDVLILCRGGGSIEDLWAFNEEAVARAIAASPIPVICGVGHETDFTIADFIADRRAPTPTAAAEMVSPNRVDLAHRLLGVKSRLLRQLAQTVEQRMQQLDYLARRLIHPVERLAMRQAHLVQLRRRYAQAASHALADKSWRLEQHIQRLRAVAPNIPGELARLESLSGRLQRAVNQRLAVHQADLHRLESHLQHLDPQAVFERGFSMVQNARGAIVRDSQALTIGENVRITYAQGKSLAQILELE
ncbi:MAG: exodeoxyribonuclease VII large subunit [Sulfuricellaceae bacterium]